MKKIISYLMIAFVAINITSCSKDDQGETQKIEDLKLSIESPLELLSGSTTEVTVKGGDSKTYTATSSDTAIANVEVKSNKLTIAAGNQGEATITIKSAGKSIKLVVNVIPALTEAGVYNLDGTSAFEVKSVVSKVGVAYGFFANLNPTKGKMLMVDLIDTPAVGTTQSITVKARDIDGLQSGSVTTQVENVSEKVIQLKSDKYRIVLPKK